MYLLPENGKLKIPVGIYRISANYYSNQASSLTGPTSCIIWCVTHLGDFEEEEIGFQMVRLDTTSREKSLFEVQCDAVSS